MPINIAACGLVCSQCDAYRATAENSQSKLELVAADWRQRYHCDQIKADNIRCNGCMTEGGPKCGHCESQCQIRRCALDKKINNCGECADFPCGKLEEFFGFVGPQGQAQKELLSAIADVKEQMHSAF